MLRHAVKSSVLQRLTRRASTGTLPARRLSTVDLSVSKEEEPCRDQESQGELSPSVPATGDSERLAEFRKKLKEDITSMEMNRYSLMTPKENDPLPPWPDNVNPHTGEVGGPRGPEPTRYGDWERKGICVDF